MSNKINIPHKRTNPPSFTEDIIGGPIPEQILDEKSWVAIYASTESKEAEVIIFNNNLPYEDFQFQNFADWTSFISDDFLEEGKFGKGKDISFDENKDGSIDSIGSLDVNSTDGIQSYVLHFYNGSITADNLQAKVNLCANSVNNQITDYVDDVNYEKELARERLFRP